LRDQSLAQAAAAPMPGYGHRAKQTCGASSIQTGDADNAPVGCFCYEEECHAIPRQIAGRELTLLQQLDYGGQILGCGRPNHMVFFGHELSLFKINA
jgi:hypothetical protein